MANGETAKDLHLEILRRCGEKDDGSSEYHGVALDYLNKCYQKIICGASEFELDLGEPWPWAKSLNKITLTILPFIGTDGGAGSANVTFNSPNGTFTQVPMYAGAPISLQGWWFYLNDSTSEWYQIKTHVVNTTSFVLDTTFNDQTQSNASFLCCLLDYTLTAPGQISSPITEQGGIQRLAAPIEVYRQQDFSNDNEFKIYGVDVREMRRQYPISNIELGIPTRFAIMNQEDGVFTIRFNKFTNVQTRADVEYIAVPEDLTSNPDSIPLIPREFRDVLIYGPSYWLMIDKSDDRAPAYLQMTQSILKAMITDARKKRDHIQKQKATLVPRWDLFNQKKRILYF